MDKNVKKNKVAKEQADEKALNSIFAWLGGGAILEGFLLLLNRFWVNYYVSEISFRLNILDPAVKILAFLALAGAVVAALRWKKDTSKRLPLAVAAVALGCSVGCFAAWLLGDAGLTALYTAVPVITLLAVIFHLYQPEFFLISTLSALGIFGVWLCSHGVSGRTAVVCWIYTLAALTLIGLSVWFCFGCRKESGSFVWKGKQLLVFGKDANYLPAFISAAVSAGVLICALLGLPVMALYGISVAWLLVMAVFYTVKLM